MSPTLNGEVLKNIAHKNQTATIVATALALRQRMRTESDVTRTWFELIRAGEKVDQKEYFQFWKDLQDAGVGSLIHGRKGNHDKFAWNYSLKSIGRSMIEGGNVNSERLTEEPKRTPEVEKVVEVSSKGKRGRPKGSKNKRKPSSGILGMSSSTSGKGKRGRPKRLFKVALRDGITLEIDLSNEKLAEFLKEARAG